MSLSSRRWLRRLSAAGIVGLLLVIGSLVVQRLHRLTTPVELLTGDEIRSETSDPAVGIYTGFEFVERVAGREVFRLLSKRTLGLSSGWHEIEGVRLQFYRDGEPGPVLTCDGARFNIQTRDAELAGGVRIQFPGGAMISTDGGSFAAGSRTFSANSAVTFVSGATFGTAGRAAYDLELDRVVLGDGIVLHTESGATLRAPTALYERGISTLGFPQGAEIELPRARIEAPVMSAVLEAGEGPVRDIEMSGGVTATSFNLEGTGMGELRAERITASVDGSGRWQIEAATGGPWIRALMVGGEAYLERELTTMVLRGVLGDEGLINLRAESGVCLREVPAEGALRWAEAETARVWFADGQATDVELVQGVLLRGEGIEARGYRARMSPQAGLTMLHGEPTGRQRVLLVSERGRLSCDQAQLFNREGRSEARGNVQGEIHDVSLVGGRDGGTEGPAHFASDSLDVTEEGAVYTLRGSARVWQGPRLLLADDVVYRHVGPATIRAAGHVRTTLPATELGLDSQKGGDVVVVSRSLDYDEAMGSAVYRGNVRYSDPQHTLAAAELSVHFDAGNEVTAVEATGAVEVVILESGRRMTGQHARREVREQLLTITGSPVRVSDPAGNEVSGSSLTWNQADGTVAVAGGTETIYYPEERP